MGRGTLGEVQDGTGDSREGPGRFGGPSNWSRTGRWDPRGGLGRVGGPSGRSMTGRGGSEWVGEVWDRLGDPQGGLGRVVGPLRRSGTGHGTLKEVRDG